MLCWAEEPVTEASDSGGIAPRTLKCSHPSLGTDQHDSLGPASQMSAHHLDGGTLGHVKLPLCLALRM